MSRGALDTDGGASIGCLLDTPPVVHTSVVEPSKRELEQAAALRANCQICMWRAADALLILHRHLA